ncbi:MAG TPA: PIN domain-containing protein [Thermoplasmata archaeon]
MSVFLDTGVVVAAHNTRDPHHGRALEILSEVREGTHGTGYSSDFVLDEAVTLALVRTKSRRIALDVGRFFVPEKGEPGMVALLHVDEGTVRRAWESFVRRDTPLSFTDWTIVEQVRALDVDRVASFDGKLDPWVARLA